MRHGLHRPASWKNARQRGLDAPLHRPVIRERKMRRTQYATIEPTTAPPCVLIERRRTSTEERPADFWRMRVRALVPSLLALARTTLHQSSPPCRSLRCVPVNAESYRCSNAVQMPMVAVTVVGLNPLLLKRRFKWRVGVGREPAGSSQARILLA